MVRYIMKKAIARFWKGEYSFLVRRMNLNGLSPRCREAGSAKGTAE
jgi:hypothetical protein